MPTATDVAIHIGDVLIEPGDFLLGDRDGMVRVPKAQVPEITQKSIVAMNTESNVRTAIIGGMDPQQAYLKYGKF